MHITYVSISLQSAAAAVRAATDTVHNWKYWHSFSSTKASASWDYPATYFAKDLCSPQFWDSPPFAINLAFAAAGLVLSPH